MCNDICQITEDEDAPFKSAAEASLLLGNGFYVYQMVMENWGLASGV